MAAELHIKHGDEAVNKKDFACAIAHYNAALKENPEAFLGYIKRSGAYLKLSDYSSARKDIERAKEIARKRGKRDDQGLCFYKDGLINYAEKQYVQALESFRQAKASLCSEPALDIWIAKAERDLRRVDAEVKPKVTKVPEEHKLTSVDAINKHAPLKAKIRDDWYQSNETVTVTIYAKNVKEETLSVKFEKRSVSISFPSADSSEYNYNLDPLYGEIDCEKSTYKIYSTKLEITLQKMIKGKWAQLEGHGEIKPVKEEESRAPLAYPTSSRKAVNWSNFNVPEEEEEEQDFFAKLYRDVDDDTRRAMMKSYVESNGTVLTTNWAEAQTKHFETSPPEGMEAKKWNS